jgi:antirestriction protein ArdC
MTAAEPMAGVVAWLVAQIEAGAATWEMPWRNFAASGWPTNAATGHRYGGGNAIILSVAAIDAGYPSVRWATYKQWAGLGAQVRRGEHATTGIYWHTEPATDTPAANDNVSDAAAAARRFVWARVFHVFNAAQVDGDTNPPTPADVVDPLARDTAAEAWFANVPAAVGWGEGNPCYRPAVDRVVMPPFDAFNTASDAYATLAHELGHWSGHPIRLNRSFGARFGDHAYAAEELVAELSAAFTCAVVGLDTVARPDHAAYLAHWCELLRQQPAVLWTVAAKAQAATDLLASYQPARAESPA